MEEEVRVEVVEVPTGKYHKRQLQCLADFIRMSSQFKYFQFRSEGYDFVLKHVTSRLTTDGYLTITWEIESIKPYVVKAS
ncbi:MAG: hypothetical protein KIH08_15770 [Candidatus Freyarchaeota archaeon]|nr:hypothetical protein [Candidatus Jordarchaeia archaeon]